jgi:phosphohistidine phosphatase
MKEVILLRHAKSSWKNPLLRDIERPLNKDGITEALELTDWLKVHKINPHIVVCSTSARTYQTFLIANSQFEIKNSKLILEPTLYESTLKQYLNTIKKYFSSCSCLMIVGHNPVITELAAFICGYNKEILTGSLLRIKMNVNNSNEIKKNCGNLISEFIPSRHLNYGKI